MRAIDYFDKGAEAFPGRIAIIDRTKQYSYGQAREASRRIAKAMWAAGLRGEERVAIFSPNDGRVLLCMLGLMRAGGVWVPINYRNALDANVQFLNYSLTSWLLYHSSFQEQVRQIKSLVPALRHFVCIDAETDGDPSLESFMQQGEGTEEIDWGDARGNLERLAGLVPTGGTTGPAKGVMVTNLSWGTMIELAHQNLRCEGSEPICLSTAPLSHAAGVVAFAMFSLGATNVVLPAFDALEVLESIERFRVTHIFLPPTAYYALLAHPKLGDFNYADPATVAAAAAGDHPERLRSCGKPTLAVRLAIMDDKGKLLPPLETGEIVARGALVGAGYYDFPEATAEIQAHGWHHTGDVGYRDDDGFFYIVDRKKDLIITGGFNVYCAEVEACVMELSQVCECAVIGVPDEKWGEAVKAIVVLRDGESLEEEAVIAHCKTRLGGVKSPKSVDFRCEIPKTPAGKTDKRTLRKPFWAGADRAVH